MATDTPNTIPRWHEALLLQIVIALIGALGFGLRGNLEQLKFWLIGAAIAAIPHAIFVYYAGRYQQAPGVRKTLRSTQRGLALKMAVTAVLFMWTFKVNGSTHAVVMLLGFAMTTLVGAVYPWFRKDRQ